MLPSLSERPAHMSWGRQVRGTAQALAQDSVGDAVATLGPWAGDNNSANQWAPEIASVALGVCFA
jgi:hypothetical protein